jgi:methanogenic corrinoid protein MtbC1
LRAGGMPVGAILVDLFAPAARELGRMWDDDDCTFYDVTSGLAQLHTLLRRFGQDLGVRHDPSTLGFRVFLASLPGDQHTFGISMVEELFRESGWDTVGLSAPSTDELRDAVAADWYAVVGLSVSRDLVGDDLRDLLTDLRRIAPNPNTFFMVGGHYFNEHPEQVALVGADGSAVDGRQAILAIRNLLGLAAA